MLGLVRVIAPHCLKCSTGFWVDLWGWLSFFLWHWHCPYCHLLFAMPSVKALLGRWSEFHECFGIVASWSVCLECTESVYRLGGCAVEPKREAEAREAGLGSKGIYPLHVCSLQA